MSDRKTGILAWSMFGLFVAIGIGSLELILFGPGSTDELFFMLLFGFAFVGLLVTRRQRGNAIGWLLLAIAISFSLTALVDSYVRSETAPALEAVAWVSHWVWYVWITLTAIFLPLLFPDGRLLSRRWRPVLWLGGASLALRDEVELDALSRELSGVVRETMQPANVSLWLRAPG